MVQRQTTVSLASAKWRGGESYLGENFRGKRNNHNEDSRHFRN